MLYLLNMLLLMVSKDGVEGMNDLYTPIIILGTI